MLSGRGGENIDALMRRHTTGVFLLVLLLPALAAGQPSPEIRTVVRPVLNMHSSPSSDADVVSQAIYATPVAILEQKNGWTRVRTPDEYLGWVETSALALRAGRPYATGPGVVQVRSLFAHIYREASVTRHAPILTVPFETRLELDVGVPDKPERWLTIRLADGRKGSIQSADVGPPGTSLTIDETIALARRFLGLPYTWGGTSSYGFDCSGFTQMLMRQRGHVMPRDAKDQAVWQGLDTVDRGDLRPGDLLYFGSSEQRITHTGLYIGDRQFINATTHERPVVRIDNLDDPYWAKLLVAARRVKP
jgi:cell wall-associated NlpC family hydrolase